VVVSAIWIGAMFGLGNQLSRAFQHVFHAPLPVVLTNGMRRAALTPPAWLERWAWRAGLSPIERAFGVVYHSLRWLGQPVSRAETPRQAAQALARRLPSAAAEIQVLLDQFQANTYSNKSGDLPKARQAAESIRRRSQRAVLQDRLATVQRFLRITR